MTRLLPRLALAPGLVLGLGLALAACTPYEPEWSEVEAPKTAHVDQLRLSHSASFVPGAAGLSAQEEASLSRFLAEADVEPSDEIYLQAAPGDRLAAARIGRITKALARRGIVAVALPADGTVSPNHMAVRVERYVVTPPDCPNWSKSPIADHANALPSNFGCATASNLDMMVADPHDLVVGRSLGPADAIPDTLAVRRYRAGNVLPLPVSNTGSDAPAPAATPSPIGGGSGGAGGNSGSGG